jgi:hypothetical protein
MNLNPKVWKRWEDWTINYKQSLNAEETNTQYIVEFKDFFIPVEECIRRDAMRSNPIGEKVIRETWKRYKHFIQTTCVENYVNNLIKPHPIKASCIVIDMDSTMCFNTSKRPWFGDDSTKAMINDIPNIGVVDIIHTLQKNFPIIVCTGRSQAQKEVTVKWLAKYDIFPKDFYMRTDGDYRKGVEVKTELINQILEKYNIISIFEDCEPIVQKFREMGLTVLQPNNGL